MGIANQFLGLGLCCLISFNSIAQVPPDASQLKSYQGLFSAVVQGDSTELKKQILEADDIDARDDYQRTALHVATYLSNHDAMRLLVHAGANPNALESDRYDMVTIAAVANDLQTMTLALQLGNRADNITSRYDGTALIAAAHLGHVEIVKKLIAAGAPLDHVNNLNWTALIESIVLGDGGANHTETLKALVEADADLSITDASGNTPLALAKQYGYRNMIKILQQASAK